MGGLLLTCLFCSSLLIPSLSLAQEGEQKVPVTAGETPEPIPETKEESPGAPAQAPITAPAEGKQIKTITLTELREMLSDKYRGKVVILNFFSPYCGKCQELLPMLEELYGKYTYGFMVIGISMMGYPEKVWLSINRVRINFPVFMGDADVFNAYEIHTLPSITLIGKDGKEEGKEEGHDISEKKLEREVTRLIEGRPRKGWLDRILP